MRNSLLLPSALACLVLSSALVPATPALAARARPRPCSTPERVDRVASYLDSEVQCNDERLELGASAACDALPSPGCAQRVPDDALALAYGEARAEAAAVGAAHPDQLACQQQVGASMAGYLRTYLGARVAGDDAEAAHGQAAAELTPLAGSCDGVVPVALPQGGQLPAVGVQCAAAVGGAVAADGLSDCLGRLLGVWAERIGPDPQPLRPNIVLIYVDDQRFDALEGEHSLDGSDVMPAVMNEIAASGIRFTQGFSTTPLCSPSRASVLTGQRASTHGVRWGGPPTGGATVFDDSSTLATWLQDGGYRTGLIGKYQNDYAALWQPGTTPYIPPGWDEWVAFKFPGYLDYILVRDDGQGPTEVTYVDTDEEYSTDLFRDEALEFLDDSVAGGQPFFLYWAPMAPHLPAIPAPRHDGDFAALPPYRPESYKEPDVSDKPGWFANLTEWEDSDIDFWRRKQLEIGLSLDEAVQSIIDRLRTHGILDETFIVYTSDNGYLWGEHGLVAKNYAYQESIRVPLIVRYPPLAPQPRVDDSVVANIDLASTIAALAGVDVGVPQDGRSLVRLLDGTSASWREFLLTEGWSPGKEWVALVNGTWKYTEYARYGPPAFVRYTELYDLIADPLELESLHDDPAQADRNAEMAAEVERLRPTWPDDAEIEY